MLQSWVTTELTNVQNIQKDLETGILVNALNEETPWFARMNNLSKRAQFVGTGAAFRIITDAGYNAGPRLPGGDVQTPRNQGYAKGHVDLFEVTASQGMSKEEREENGGPTMTANLVAIKNTALGVSMRRDINQNWAGDGTGRLARIKARSGAQSYTCDNTCYDFGISNVQKLRVGDLVDIYAVAGVTVGGTDDWTERVVGAVVTSVTLADDGSDGAFTISATVGTQTYEDQIADNDIVFMHGSAQLELQATSHNHFKAWTRGTGIMAICDNTDGTWGAAGDNAWIGPSFQNLTRMSYPTLQAYVQTFFDGSNAPGSWELSDLDEHIIMMENMGGRSNNKISVLAMHPLMWNTMRQKAIAMDNPFQTVTNGKLIPGITIMSYRLPSGRVVDLLPNFSLPRHCIYGLAEADLGIIEPVPVGFWGPEDETNWFASPGARNGTWELWSRWKGNMIAERADGCMLLKGLSETP